MAPGGFYVLVPYTRVQKNEDCLPTHNIMNSEQFKAAEVVKLWFESGHDCDLQ